MKSVKFVFLVLIVALATMASAPNVASSAPTPTSPINGFVSIYYRPTLTWLAAIPATGTTISNYQIQYSLASNFSYALVTVATAPTATSYQITTPLAAGRTYYWRMRARNNLGEWSVWSNTTYFRTAIYRPTLTAFVAPNPLTLRPTFKWSAVTKAQSYTIQISEDCGFLTAILSVTTATNAYTPDVDLPAAIDFCWRVRANNNPYGPSAWSATSTFLSPNPPGIATLAAPVNNTLTNDSSPRLSWYPVTLAAGTAFGNYEVELADTSDFLNYTYHKIISVTPANAIVHSYYDVPDTVADRLPGAATTYWRVRSYNSAGEYSAWSSSRALRIGPDRPTNLTTQPVVPTDPRPLFNWDDVAGPGMYYRIFISTTPNFATIVLGGKTQASQYRPPIDLPRGVVIYWRVFAVSTTYGMGLGSESSFVSANPPSTPSLISPELNARSTSTTPTFQWSVSSVPTGTSFHHYQIVISEVVNFAVITTNLNRPNVYNTSYTPSVPLKAGQDYYWMVRACNTVGQCSTWSAKYKFTTAP
ncbi:MAG: fibronectin type III domain-containing protein [Anaerolineales bacterium]|nr:fibronectin type III domain-containing protein [Anaerolineales bacterium]